MLTFRFRNGLIDCRADCSDDKVDIRIYVTSRPVQGRPRKLALPRVYLNTSLLGWSNLYLVWLVDEFLRGGASIETSVGR